MRESIIDTDIHPAANPKHIAEFLPQPWRARWEMGNMGSPPLGYWNPNGVRRVDAIGPDGAPIASDPVHLSKLFFDPYGIEYGIFLTEPHQVLLTPEPDFAAAVASAINDVMIKRWLPVDARFRIAMHVSPVDPALAAREIHRVGDTPGVAAVMLPSGARMAYGDRYYDPIYQAATEHHLPICMHPGTEGAGISGAPTSAGYPGSYFEWHTGLVSSFITHLVSLLAQGTFQKFPGLTFVLVEGGVSWIPPVLWRMDKNWKGLRKSVPWLDRLPSEIAREHIRMTTQPIEEPDRPGALQDMLGMFDAAKMLMFSSDFPHWDGDTPDFAGRHFKGELRRRVMSETAREVYRLPPPAGG